MKRKILIGSLVAVMMIMLMAPSFTGRADVARSAAPVAGPAQSHPAIFDKTRFVLHMGFAYFAFHHWVYKPFKAGDFAPGAHHRLLNLGKAALAVLFTVHELKKSYKIAHDSHSATLHALIAPLAALVALVNREHEKLKGCESGTQSSDDANSYDVTDNGSVPTATATPAPGATPTASSTPGTTSCSYSATDITGLNSAVDSFTTVAAHNGVTITDKTVPALPGLS
jgi:hypothetical protein